MGPEELLAQIRSLLDEYLALGGDTPVAPEAEAFAQAIDAATGGGGEEGMPTGGPMDPGQTGTPPVEEMPPPEEGLEGGSPAQMEPPAAMPTDFKGASALALEDLKKKTKKGSY